MLCCDANHNETAELVYIGKQPFVFEVHIERRRDKRLGLDLDFVPERKVLPVRSLIANQLAEDWNAMHESKNRDLQLRPGDRIVSVNGTTGRADDMMRALRDTTKATTIIKLVRLFHDTHETDDQDTLDAADAFTCSKDNSLVSTKPDFGAMVAVAGAALSFGYASKPKVAPRELTYDDIPIPLPENEKERAEFAESARRALFLDEARRDLPAPWLAIWSRSQNKYYFFNPRSQASAWRKPLPGPDMDEEEEGNGSIVGSWAYSDGAYTITKTDNELRYREDAHGVHGIVEEHDGWLLVDLLLMRDDASRVKGESIGRLRFLRRGAGVVSNFQRVGHGDVWEEDVIATQSMRIDGKPEDSASLVGSWSYHNGTYSVSRKEDRLLYEESCYGIYGWLEEVPSGYMQAELRAISTTPGEPAGTVGWIRLKRRGPLIVSNYKGPEDTEWEPDSLGTKEAGSVEGEWMYPDGTYTITNKHGFLLYEEPSCGIYGVLQQETSGWLEADLLVPVTRGAGQGEGDEKRIGKIRVQRRGQTIVSNFRGMDTDPWERDIISTRVDGR